MVAAAAAGRQLHMPLAGRTDGESGVEAAREQRGHHGAVPTDAAGLLAGHHPDLHRFCQVIGKLRLAASARRNHWWNLPFHLTGRGITTRPMARSTTTRSSVSTWTSSTTSSTSPPRGPGDGDPRTGQSVASFGDQTLGALATLGIGVAIAHPTLGPADAHRPLADDPTHAGDDPAWATRSGQVLGQVNLALEEFAARFSGKVSPVHPSGTPLPSPPPALATATSTSRQRPIR